MNQMTEFQQDAISELLNIGMGAAAASLSQMVNEPVNLSIPSVEFLPQKLAAERIKQLVGNKLTAVRESFSGTFWGDALLIFPEQQSLALVRALLKDEALPLEILSEMEQEALTEVGNIILNACLGSLANVFQQNLEYELPIFTQGTCEEVLKSASATSSGKDGVLLLQMDFSLQATNVNGFLTLLMDVDSMDVLSKEVDNYFSNL
jgi:chemotaxis protein CheC